uniref:Myosin motor domain-containing protein n=1 Tax=Heterorhabditis bacteriophora TaxID=37862 RepID=A0A1I7WWK0_HETBA
MVLVTKGDFIWIEPTSNIDGIPIGARVVDQDQGRLRIVDDHGNQWLSTDRRVRIMHPTSVQGVEDMCQLGDYHESAILRNIFVRYREKLIYTYTGSILIAMNPYMDLPIYTAEQIRMYKKRKIGELPPHIFAVADNVYWNMRKNVRNQSVVISGESGAGKTESTKLVLQFLATISGQHSWIEQQVLEANPILEAFGNAKTIKNDNSSRFGKYIDVHFNAAGSIEGARIEQYLLEKSRIVSQVQNERNYHIFYCLLAGLSKEEKKELELTNTADYYYLAQVKQIIRINKLCGKTSTILHEQDIFDVLTTRTLVTRDERVVSHLTGQQAVNTRDSLVKGIYGRLFIYIVGRINDTIYKPRSDSSRRNSIGVLDIFGFENFDSNSFEQLCINYANENLQQFFVRHVFKQEQAEYDQEQINWRHIKFIDNQETLDLIAHRPMNILSLIDEESIFPKATDQTMLDKLHSTHSKNESFYLRPKSDIRKAFGIKHFAGPVYYNVRGVISNIINMNNLINVCTFSSKIAFFSSLLNSSRRKGATVGGQFRKSLDQLMQQLGHTEPFFIRCIKPNEFKRALIMDRNLVLRQLRYSGMMETIKIRRSGYPIRHAYYDFVLRYRVLVNGIAAKKICTQILTENADFQLGKTKVFLKDKHDLFLEQEYHRMLNKRATIIQKTVKGWYARIRFINQRKAALIIQKNWKAYDQRRRYQQIVTGFCRLQAILRSRQLVIHYQTLRHNIIQFQATCRGALLRSQVREMRKKGKKKAIVMMDDELKEVIPEDIKEEELSSPCPEIYSREDLSKYQFGKFAATFFQSQATSNHIKQPLKEPLLLHEDPSTQLGALAVWTTILRFMGDLPDVKIGSTNGEPHYHTLHSKMVCHPFFFLEDKTPVMTRLYSTLGRKISKRDVDEASIACEFDAVGSGRTLKKGMGKKLISLTLKKKSKLSEMQSTASNRSSDSSSSGINVFLENKPMSSLDKLHYIIGLGILKEELRCQNYHLLIFNNRGNVQGCFNSTSVKSLYYFRDEIYCQLCKQLSNNPSRLSAARGWILLSLCVGCFAPTDNKPFQLKNFASIILQANKSKKPIVLAITFMDGSVKTLCADSATTSKELCDQLAEKIGLKDKFGFSLYIALFDKVIVSSLGSDSDHIMDAISHVDSISTNLIYQQVIRGVKYGEYRCSKDDDLAMLVAEQYYIDEGTMEVSRLEAQLTNYLPDFELLGKEMAKEKWIQAIMHQYRKKNSCFIYCLFQKFFNKQPLPCEVKEDVVAFAKFKWPLLFSRFYEALKFAGPPLPRNKVIIAVNWTGIYVVDDKEKVLLEFSYPEIVQITHEKRKPLGADICTFRTISGDEYSFQSPNSEDICDLVLSFLDGLKKRSRYLVATNSQEAEEPNNYLEFEKGDLLTILDDATGENLLIANVVKGENMRTCLQGFIRSENVYVLPTITKPNISIVVSFQLDDNFLFSREEQVTEAITIYSYLMKYMGDQPSRRCRLGIDLTDHIFKPALSQEILRDELYCQLMKQLTMNPSMLSEERGWELLWLAAGLFAPSQSLMKEVGLSNFLITPSHRLPNNYLKRKEKSWNFKQFLCRAGSRKYPPHLVEVEAIQHKTTQIFHKVSSQISIVYLHVIYSSQYWQCPRTSSSLILSASFPIGCKTIIHTSYFFTPHKCVYDQRKYYVSLRPVESDRVLAITRAALFGELSVTPINYQVYFMKKLWINVVPGEDINADLIFYYYQEAPKYLLGYHKTTIQDVVDLAAIILRSITCDTKNAPLAQIPQLLNELVPKDMLKMNSLSEWRKLISSAYAKVEHVTSNQAKIEFLKYISKWPTFGSAFFPVSQYSDLSLPDKLLIAINQNGVNIYNAETKNLIIQYPFNAICNWTSGNTYFNMTVGNVMRGNEGKKLLLDTTKGYKMDDLLTSYLSLLISDQTRNPKASKESGI